MNERKARGNPYPAAHEGAVRETTIDYPEADDAAAVNALIARCPPLDRNSLYCNLIQCTHFAGTSAIARLGPDVVGFVSGHLLPEARDVLFVWQVAVDPATRGLGVARRMIGHILERAWCSHVRLVHTTVTPSNRTSRAMFAGLAGDLGTSLAVHPCFDSVRHLAGAHESEELLVIGPFRHRPRNQSKETSPIDALNTE